MLMPKNRSELIDHIVRIINLVIDNGDVNINDTAVKDHNFMNVECHDNLSTVVIGIRHTYPRHARITSSSVLRTIYRSYSKWRHSDWDRYTQ